MTDPQHEETFADTERKLREIITTLRAQLAKAQRLMRLERTIADKKADRADRAEQRVATLEAALAAQIEADMETCGQCMGSGYGGHPDSGVSCPVCGGSGGVRNQPHDRTALDRYREKVLREAAAEAERTGTCLLPSGHFLSERCRDAILALIEAKP